MRYRAAVRVGQDQTGGLARALTTDHEKVTKRELARTRESLTWSNGTSRQWNPSRRWVAAAAQGKGNFSESVGYPRFRADLRLIYYGPAFRPNTVGQPTNFWGRKNGALQSIFILKYNKI